jgi:cell division septation protein DedD
VEAIGSATRARVESAATGASERDTTGTRAAESASAPATLVLLESESFTIVVASFRTTARVGAVVAELEKQELPAYARDVPGGWHQVMVGPYASRAEAEEVQRQLVANRWAGSQIVSSETGGAFSSAESADLN